jgi:hypothetical protein
MKKKWVLILSVSIVMLLVPQINALLMNSAHSPPLSFCREQKNVLSCQDLTWSKILGKMFPTEEGFSTQQVRDGGYILVGTAYQANGGILLVKMDTEGGIEWERYIGGAYTTGKYVEETSDGGFILAAENMDGILLLKTDVDGNEVWSRVFSDGWMRGDRLISQTDDGGFLVIGTTHDEYDSVNVWLIKTDAFGKELWNRTYGGTKGDNGGSVQQTKDGGYIFTGVSSSYGVEHEHKQTIWLVKTDEKGDKEWNTTFGEGYVNRGYSVEQTTDGGYIVGGVDADGGCIIKTDSHGNLQWKSSFYEYDCFVIHSVQQTEDGGYILTGTSGEGYFVAMDLYLIKVDQYGDVQWVKIFGEAKYCEYGNCVRQTSDGGYIVTGAKQRFKVYAGIAPLFLDMWVIKTDEHGNSDKSGTHYFT